MAPEKALEKQIGDKLKKLRLKAGFSSAEAFAYQNEFSRTQYQAYEAVKVKMRIDTLHKILEALGIKLEDFFKGIN
jgi:transcriptional regulator with XRE-family HTH domain